MDDLDDERVMLCHSTGLRWHQEMIQVYLDIQRLIDLIRMNDIPFSHHLHDYKLHVELHHVVYQRFIQSVQSDMCLDQPVVQRIQLEENYEFGLHLIHSGYM